MNQLTESPPPARQSSPVKPRAPYVAPRLEIHDSWVLATGISFAHDAFLAERAERSS